MTFTFEDSISFKDIQQLRAELIRCGIENGLCHPSTVKLSQRLDKLLYNRFLSSASK